MDAQLFIRTWENDLDWLEVCLRSVLKYWRSKWPPVIVATPACRERLQEPLYKSLNPTVYFEPRWEVPEISNANDKGRYGPLYIGLTADKYSDATAILVTDSDCVFTKPCTANDFVDDLGNIIIRGALFDFVHDPHNQHCYDMYRRVILECLGIQAQYECMRFPPYMYFTHSFTNCRHAIEAFCGAPLKEIMLRYHPGHFCEINLLGSFCLEREIGYVVKPDIPVSERFIRQYHSWSMTPQSKKEELALLLK